MMRRIVRLGLCVVVLAAGATGCGNSLYYYETDKLSLTLEGRPDVTQPVSGSFGFKQRVVAVVPPRDPGRDGNGDSKGDAVSMVSRFGFYKARGNVWLEDPILIRTALITGPLAARLPSEKRAAAAQTFADVFPRGTGVDPDVAAAVHPLSQRWLEMNQDPETHEEEMDAYDGIAQQLGFDDFAEMADASTRSGVTADEVEAFKTLLRKRGHSGFTAYE